MEKISKKCILGLICRSKLCYNEPEIPGNKKKNCCTKYPGRLAEKKKLNKSWALYVRQLI
jgi:hypothetical protein